jgi:hypothetical protein
MNGNLSITMTFTVLLAMLAPQLLIAQENLERRVEALERRVEVPRTIIQEQGPSGAVLFLFGAFCALWAQNTNRSSWLWFFLGLLFSVITVIFLLVKNSEDRQKLERSQITLP